MYKFLQIIFILCFITSNAFSASLLESFENDFNSVNIVTLDEKNLYSFIGRYSRYLCSDSDNDLTAFKSREKYKNNIEKILNSKNPNLRILSYFMLALMKDRHFNGILRERIKNERLENTKIWAGTALMVLKDTHTDELFDFLVENENCLEGLELELFLSLDANLLRETAYKRINSSNDKAKILSVRILARTGLTPEAELILKDAVQNWSIETKGWAISALKGSEEGNLRKLLMPLLNDPVTRRISLEALARSPTKEDQDYFLSQIPKSGIIDEVLLNSLLDSGNETFIHKWLKLIQSENVPEDYYFSAYDHSILKSQLFLEPVIDALCKIKKPGIVSNLVRALEGRKDKKSTDILVKLLRHEDHSVRYWSAHTLKGNKSEMIVEQLPDLIKDEKLRTVALTDLAIENNIDSLYPIYENIYAQEVKNNKSSDWRRSSIEYLSYFPQNRHREIFRNILKAKNEDFSILYDAALGLGRLKDESSVDLIIDTMLYKSREFDLNARVYMTALSFIKTEKSKKAIKRYLRSKDEIVMKHAKSILDKW